MIFENDFSLTRKLLNAAHSGFEPETFVINLRSQKKEHSQEHLHVIMLPRIELGLSSLQGKSDSKFHKRRLEPIKLFVINLGNKKKHESRSIYMLS